MDLKFLQCKECGKIVAVIKDSACPTKCCGQNMEEITANTVDASKEKHVPVYKVEGNIVTVNVGSVDHPMLDNHYIEFIILKTKEGKQRKELKPGDKPEAKFALVPGDSVEAVYAYCNLHGLWKA